jgi:spermidine/putrescine transport system permease protein
MAGNLARGNDLGIGQGKGLRIITYLGIAFLLAPLVILIIYSFNESRTPNEWTGFSLKWYKTVFADAGLWLSVKNSLVIAIVSTLVTTILGTIGAILLGKHNFRGKDLFQNLLYVPVILPEIIFGVSLLALFMLIKFPLGILSVICAHITFSFPFVTMIILTKVINLPDSLEEASLDLGASRWQTFMKVILPNISPGVVSGALFAFTLSIDDFIVTFFTAGVGSSTLPLKIYSLIKFGITPAINAISTILIVFTVVALYASNRLQKSEKIGRKFKLGLGGFLMIIIGFLVVSPFFSKSGNSLHIYNYSNYVNDSLITEFEAQTGIDVTIDYYNENEELLTRLQMGVAGYDLIVPAGYMVKILKDKGLITPIDFTSIPNYSFIMPGFKKMAYDTTGTYFVPYSYGFTALVYNTDFIHDSINSWKVMWDPKYKGKISMVDDMREVFFSAYKVLGLEMDMDTLKLDKARDLLILQKPLLKKYESNSIPQFMAAGDLWMAQAWTGQIARLVASNPKFKIGIPRDGVQYWTDNLCIPTTAVNKKNAELFINFIIEPANSARNIRAIYYGMPNDSARKLLEPSLRDNEIIFPVISDFSKLEVVADFGEFNKEFVRAWTELKIR